MNIIEKNFKISNVTIYPKTARITRSLPIKLSKGENKLIINNLPESITEDSIRVEFENNSSLKIIDVFSTDDYIEKLDENQYRKKEAELQEKIDKKKELEVLIKNLTDEFNIFLNKNKLLDSIYEDHFKPIDVNTWNDFFKFLDEKLKINRDSFRKILFKWIDLEQKIITLKSNLEKYKSYDQLKEHKIITIIESDIQKEEIISIHYLQPDVRWHPAYTLRADLNKNTLSVNLFAMITQATGEDWNNLDILLSTAIPLQNCDIPEIKSKRIKEKETEIVMPKPEVQIPSEDLKRKQSTHKDMPRRLAKSAALSFSAKIDDYYDEVIAPESEKELEEEPVVAENIPEPPAGAASGVAKKRARRQEDISQDRDAIYDNELSKINNIISNIDKKIIPGFSLNFVSGYYNDLFNYLQSEFNPDEMTTFGKPVSVNQVFLNEISLLDSFGGYDYRYKVKSKKNHIPSFDLPTQVGVEIKELPMDLIYITVPVEKESVFLKATFSNTGNNPFPAGPAQIFLENNLIGDIIFPTLGQNEGTSICLGIDKDIKVIRRENKNRETKGLVGKDIITKVDVEIELINYKNKNIQIEVIDRIPKTTNNDITIYNINYNPNPQKKTLRKILLWSIILESGKKKTIKYSYSIKHPENFKLTMAYDSTPYFTGETEE